MGPAQTGGLAPYHVAAPRRRCAADDARPGADARALLKLQAFDRTRPFCFLHGDYHLGNLYFDADGAAGTLDWQSFCKGPWSHDVTYFITSALDIVDRRDGTRRCSAIFSSDFGSWRAQRPASTRPCAFPPANHRRPVLLAGQPGRAASGSEQLCGGHALRDGGARSRHVRAHGLSPTEIRPPHAGARWRGATCA